MAVPDHSRPSPGEPVGVGMGLDLPDFRDDKMLRVPRQFWTLRVRHMQFLGPWNADEFHLLDFEAGKCQLLRKL